MHPLIEYEIGFSDETAQQKILSIWKDFSKYNTFNLKNCTHFEVKYKPIHIRGGGLGGRGGHLIIPTLVFLITAQQSPILHSAEENLIQV